MELQGSLPHSQGPHHPYMHKIYLRFSSSMHLAELNTNSAWKRMSVYYILTFQMKMMQNMTQTER